jgi:trans-aconitate 2-methyltransferase
MRWDPTQYGRYADERGRPFHDLLARVGADAPRRVVDVGCGSGELTALLAQRWPDAAVEGFDSSAEMIAAAAHLPGDDLAGSNAIATPGARSPQMGAERRIAFRVDDATTWSMPADTDVLVCNAVLQWVPTHRDLIHRWASALPVGGWLAFQVPGNFDSFSHTLMRSLADSPRWTSRLTGILRHDDAVGSPTEYAGLLHRAGLSADVWETTYVHVLTGPDPVLEWVRGTGLRPVLAALSAPEAAEFVAEYAAQLREAYPPTSFGTLFPFRRIFAVGRRSS